MDINDKLKSSYCLDYALYLLGDQPLEVPAVSRREAEALYLAISKMTFPTDKLRKRARLPHRNLSGCCDDRAYVISQVLKEMGISSRDVFAVSVTGSYTEQKSNLGLNTYYAKDMPISKELIEKWGFHKAVYIHYYDNEAPVNHKEAVMEISMYNSKQQYKLVTVDKWAKNISLSPRRHRFKSLQELATLMKNQEEIHLRNGIDIENVTNYPSDVTYIFTSDRDQLYSAPSNTIDFNPVPEPTRDAIPGTINYRTYEGDGKDVLNNIKDKKPHYYIAAVIRQHYVEKHVNKRKGGEESEINQIDELCSYIIMVPENWTGR